MLVFLFLAFLLMIFNFFIIGLIFSKVNIDVENCNVFSNSIPENLVVDKMQISINLYLYKFIKILSIKLFKEYFKIGFIKIYYYKIFEHRKEILEKLFFLIKLLMGKNRLTLNIIKLDIENFYMDMSLCSKNAAVTSITTSLISGATSMLLSKFVKKYDKDKIFYKIVPVYFNINGFKLALKTKISFNTLNFLEFLYDYYLVKNNK